MGPAAAYVIEKLGEALAQAEAELQATTRRVDELEAELAKLKNDKQEELPNP